MISPNGVQIGPQAGNAFWHILKVTERYFLHLYANALSSPDSVLYHIFLGGGQLPPYPSVEPCLNKIESI